MGNLTLGDPQVGSDLLTVGALYLRESAFAVATAAILLVLAAACTAMFLIFCIIPMRLLLWRKVALVRGIENREALARNLPALRESMMRSSFLRRCWIEFDKTLIEPDPAKDEIDLVRSASRPQWYFNVYVAKLHFHWVPTLSAILVFSGLLVSLSALVFTLGSARQLIPLNNAQVSQLQEFFYGTSAQLYPAFAGITAAVVLNLIHGWGTSVIDTALQEFSAELESKFLCMSPDQSTKRERLADVLDKEDLARIVREAAISAGQSIEQTLSSSLPLRMANVIGLAANRLQQVAEQIASEGQGNSRTISADILGMIDRVIEDRMRDLVRLLEERCALLDSTIDKMAATEHQLAVSMRQSAAELLRSLITAAEVNEGLTGKLEQLGELAVTVRTSLEDPALRANQLSAHTAAQFAKELRQLARAIGLVLESGE